MAPTAVMIPPATTTTTTTFTTATDDMDADGHHSTRPCIICQDLFPSEGSSFPSCQHCGIDTRMCTSCLERAFDIAARDLGRMSSQFPPMCPVGGDLRRNSNSDNSEHQMPLETIQGLVGEEKLAWYRVALIEARTPLDDRTYCLYCGSFCPSAVSEGEEDEAMVAANVASSTAFCPMCDKYTTCRVCRQGAHAKGMGWNERDREEGNFDERGKRVHLPSACQGPAGRETAEDREFRRMALDQGMAPCPGCSALVDKVDGCAFVECWCGTTFCFRCLNPEDDCTCSSDGYDSPSSDDELRGDGLGWIDRPSSDPSDSSDSHSDNQAPHASENNSQDHRQQQQQEEKAESQEARDRRRARHRRRRHLNRRYLRRQARRQVRDIEMSEAGRAHGAVDLGDLDLEWFEPEEVEELESDAGNQADVDGDSDDDDDDGDDLEVDPDFEKEDVDMAGVKMCAPADSMEFDDDEDEDVDEDDHKSIDGATLSFPARDAMLLSNDMEGEDGGDDGSRSGRGEENTPDQLGDSDDGANDFVHEHDKQSHSDSHGGGKGGGEGNTLRPRFTGGELHAENLHAAPAGSAAAATMSAFDDDEEEEVIAKVDEAVNRVRRNIRAIRDIVVDDDYDDYDESSDEDEDMW